MPLMGLSSSLITANLNLLLNVMTNSNEQTINRWHLGIILKDARVRAGITQADAAVALGYSSAFLSQMERGHIAVPSTAVTPILQLYTSGDTKEDSKLALCILALTSREQWDSMLSILCVILNQAQEAIEAIVRRTITLRLKECGIDI